MVLPFILVFLLQSIALVYSDRSCSYSTPAEKSNIKEELNELLTGDSTKEITDDELLIINLWQTTCGPCIVEIPQLNKLVARYGDSKVRFLAFSDEKKFYLDLLMGKKKDFQFDYELSWANIEAVKLLKSLDKKNMGVAIPIHIMVKASGEVHDVLLGSSPAHIEKLDKFIKLNLN